MENETEKRKKFIQGKGGKAARNTIKKIEKEANKRKSFLRDAEIALIATVASVAPVQAQQITPQNRESQTNSTIAAEVSLSREESLSTINFADAQQEYMASQQGQIMASGTNSQSNQVQTEQTQPEVSASEIEDRQTVASLLRDDYFYDGEIEQMAVTGESTRENDTELARQGVQHWEENGSPRTSTSNYNGGQMGGYIPGSSRINVIARMDEAAAEQTTARISNEEERICQFDALTFPAMQDYVVNHEGQHMRNYANGIYEPTSDSTWLGCEATAQITAAYEVGARIAELNFVRDTYIQTGGGEAGLAALHELSGIPSHHEMINGYINMIETGQVNPLSNNPEDNKREFEAMGRLAYDQWMNQDQNKPEYIQQMANSAYREAISNHLPNVQRDEAETQRRCDLAMTVNVMVNGERKPVNFGEYVPDITIPERVSTALRTLDNNPDLVAEYAQNPEAFVNRTENLANVVNASKGKGYGVDRANKELMNIVSQSQEYSADKTPEQTRIAPQVNPNLVKMAMSQQFKR